ncbi:hypothetical protein [Halorussus sp. AFM4]|uniref:hypothetical protein n=1 Tax=Halorussus sp. AFM4 TaxID=3421651 RepID=UPI003EC11B9A
MPRREESHRVTRRVARREEGRDESLQATRRGALGLLAGGAAGLAGCSASDDPSDGEWSAVETPTAGALHGVARTRTGPCAVGEGGRVLGRAGGEWRVELDSGPTGAQNGLNGVDATANGRRAWFCGDSGVVGRYDVGTGRVTDFSAPEGRTSTWEDVAVAGLAGQEWLFLANGSGELLRGRHDGAGVSWDGVVEPGGGASALGVSFVDRGTGYVCDTSGGVYQTVDAGREWRRTGIDAAGVNLHDVAPRGPDDVAVAAGDGVIFRYNGFAWTPVSVGEADVRGIDRDRHAGLAVDAAGGVYEFTRNGWRPADAPGDAPLCDVALGTVDVPSVAVGDGGTVLERPR